MLIKIKEQAGAGLYGYAAKHPLYPSMRLAGPGAYLCRGRTFAYLASPVS